MRNITGKMVNYYFVCVRKLWLFSNYIEMEQESELVQIGSTIDAAAFSRENHNVLINGIINADFIRKGSIVHEVKKGNSIPEADEWQLKYYLYHLEKAGVQEPCGVLHYVEQHDKVEVRLTDEDKAYIEETLDDIERIIRCASPVPFERKKICKSCAYYELCAV